ncbi:hypothetical protein FRC12_018128 [Ceratobasidium sp. 428]|nr:hypothetical protein FRC12_018128 [Ceratobasidium sp. 428]
MYALGTETYCIIVFGKEVAYEKRLNLLFHPMKLIHSLDCLKSKHQQGCEAGRLTAYDQVKNDLSLLDNSCTALTLGATKDLGAFDIERVIITEGIDNKLLLLSPTYYGSLEPPSAPVYMAT